MSPISFGFIALMCVVSGFIAAFADYLGRRIGKRRHKFLGLRPRHTATLFVVGAGVLIPIVTVVTVAFLSKDVRAWLLEGEQAIKDAQKLREQRNALTTDVKTLSKDLQSTKLQKESARRQADEAELRRKALDKQVKGLSTSAKELSGRLTQLQSNFHTTNARLTSAERDLMKRASELNVARSDKDTLQKLFNSLRKQRDEAYADFQKIQTEIEKNDKLIGKQRQTINDLTTSQSELQTNFDARRKELEGDLEKTRGQLDLLKTQLKSGEEELRRVNEAIGALLNINETTRKRPLVFAMGDEVARIVVPADLSISQARNYLNSLIRSARVTAESSGSKGSSRVPAAGIFDQVIDGRMVSAEQQMSEVVSRIAGVPEARVLVATAFWNAYSAEPAPLSVTSFSNKLCFRSGEVISEFHLDGNAQVSESLTKISMWLSTDVKAAALKAGMVPAAGRPDALANVEPAQIFDLIDQIHGLGRVVRIQAVAFSDAYAAGPLKLTFRIR